MKVVTPFFIFIAFCLPLNAQMYHYSCNPSTTPSNELCWQENEIHAFDELLISWNAFRPNNGYFSIYVSVYTGVYSDWLLYATWGSNFQKGGKTPKQGSARIFYDAVEILNNNHATGFKVKIIAEEGANLSKLHSIHVCANKTQSLTPVTKGGHASTSCQLPVKGLSQMALNSSKAKRLCSPTSTTSVIRFLNHKPLDPLHFAKQCWDATYDIFGNWVFNVAAAFHQLGDSRYACWVDKLTSFDTVLTSLEARFPVVISVKSPLPGSVIRNSGHLITIIGFDAITDEVICMDPAFTQDQQTIVRYKFNDLMKAWHRRDNVAYIFSYR